MALSQIDDAARVAMLVPDSARDNYVTVVRREAVAGGISLDAARAAKIKYFETQHQADPLGGYDVLALWLKDADLGADTLVTGAEADKVRAFESAKRDPRAPQSVLDLSDDELRGEIELARDAQAAGNSPLAPVVTEDGTEVPASEIGKALGETDVKPPRPVKSTSSTPK